MAGNIATESINPVHMRRMAEALEKHYGIAREALDRGQEAGAAVRIGRLAPQLVGGAIVIAGVLYGQLARLQQAAPPSAATVRFVAFVNEEPPHFMGETMGSFAYVRGCRRRRDRVPRPAACR